MSFRQKWSTFLQDDLSGQYFLLNAQKVSSGMWIIIRARGSRTLLKCGPKGSGGGFKLCVTIDKVYKWKLVIYIQIVIIVSI